MKLYFKPEKKWWQFWKRSRYLKEGRDYVADGVIIKPLKPLVGELSSELVGGTTMNQQHRYENFKKEYEELCERYEMSYDISDPWVEGHYEVCLFDEKEKKFIIED